MSSEGSKLKCRKGDTCHGKRQSAVRCATGVIVSLVNKNLINWFPTFSACYLDCNKIRKAIKISLSSCFVSFLLYGFKIDKNRRLYRISYLFSFLGKMDRIIRKWKSVLTTSIINSPRKYTKSTFFSLSYP